MRTHFQFVAVIRKHLEVLGKLPMPFKLHSFLIGVTTEAARWWLSFVVRCPKCKLCWDRCGHVRDNTV